MYNEVEEIKNIPLFQGVDYEDLSAYLKDCEVKRFNHGDYICRQGEYNENCSILINGSASVRVPRAGSGIPAKIDLGKGEIFGEIAVMSGTPRTADVIADSKVELFNIPRNSLFRMIDKFPSIKEVMDATYRSRTLSSHLRKVPVFSGLSSEFLEDLKNKVAIIDFKKGDVIFKQGSDGDAFYLVRYGFVKISQTDSRGIEKVVAYLGEGHYFGEIALIEDEKRMATVSALNRTELIKISSNDFKAILENQPGVKTALELVIAKRLERNLQINNNAALAHTISSAGEAGVIQSKAILIMDTTKCVQCDNCVKACAALHNGQTRLIRKGTKFNDFIMLPTSCRNCDDPVCMSKCPTGAITRDFAGEIYHKDHCIGCGSCAKLCQHGNISIVTMNESSEKRNRASFFLGGFLEKIRGDAKNKTVTAQQENVPARTHFAGERSLVQRPEAKKFPGERDMFSTKQAAGSSKKEIRAMKKAAKCDMCRDYNFRGCIYNCPTGAARRIDPAEFFMDLKTFG